MSPSSPRPYQSRLFNFFNRQSLHLRDRLGETVRHLKVAAEWGVQALIYPLYWMVQNSLKTGNQIASSQHDHFALPSVVPSSDLPCDRPIGRIVGILEPVLEQFTAADREVATPSPPQAWWEKLQFWQKSEQSPQKAKKNTLALPASAPIPPLLVAPPLRLQGIATELHQRKLVLVAADNQLYDVLSDRQQQRLQVCIHRAMADYHYESRRLLAPQHKLFGVIPLTSADKSRILPPVVFAWQAWRWVQYQPAAIALEQWRGDRQSSKLALAPQKTALAIEKAQHQRIARHLAQTSQGIIPAPASSFPLDPLPDLIRAAVDHFFGSTAQTTLPASPESLAAATLVLHQPSPLTQATIILQRPLAQVSALTQSLGRDLLGDRLFPDRSLAASEPDPFQIHHILRAAIDYFFGSEGSNLALEGRAIGSRRIQDVPTSHPLPSAEQQSLADPWLMWEDLFPEAGSEAAQTFSQPRVPLLDRADPLPPPVQPRPLRSSTSSKSLKKSAKKSQKVATRSPRHRETTASALTVPPVSVTSGTIDFDPDWIEIPSQPVGYETHPLEILLDSLDRLVLWLEKALVWLWQSLKSLMPLLQSGLGRVLKRNY